MSDLLRTPLHQLHEDLGAKMVPFAGYAMPVQYPMGVLQEHMHTRKKAGLFDVSHMGQVIVAGRDFATAAAVIALSPVNTTIFKPSACNDCMASSVVDLIASATLTMPAN